MQKVIKSSISNNHVVLLISIIHLAKFSKLECSDSREGPMFTVLHMGHFTFYELFFIPADFNISAILHYAS